MYLTKYKFFSAVYKICNRHQRVLRIAWAEMIYSLKIWELSILAGPVDIAWAQLPLNCGGHLRVTLVALFPKRLVWKKRLGLLRESWTMWENIKLREMLREMLSKLHFKPSKLRWVSYCSSRWRDRYILLLRSVYTTWTRLPPDCNGHLRVTLVPLLLIWLGWKKRLGLSWENRTRWENNKLQEMLNKLYFNPSMLRSRPIVAVDGNIGI